MSKARKRAVSEVFFALGDATRLSVVRKLGTGGALTATTLSEGAKVSRQAIAKHLRVLEGAGLATTEKRGREVLYALRTEPFDDARAFLDGVSANWDRALERLRELVEEGPPRPGTRESR